MINYWVVGATIAEIDRKQEFIEKGIWMLGYGEGDPEYEKTKEMKPGDRIAIKSMKGKGQKDIKIHHIGIIKGIIRPEQSTEYMICTVNWIATDLDRDVESKGCFASVHEFSHNEWVEKVFCL